MIRSATACSSRTKLAMKVPTSRRFRSCFPLADFGGPSGGHRALLRFLSGWPGPVHPSTTTPSPVVTRHATVLTFDYDTEKRKALLPRTPSMVFRNICWAATSMDPTNTVAAAAHSASASVVLSDPLWNHFLETVINTAVPSVTLGCVGLTGWLLVRGVNRGGAKKSSKTTPKDKSKRRHNPAAELYDDLYVDDAPSKKRKTPAEEIVQFVQDLSRKPKKSTDPDHKAIRRRNKGLPAQEYIKLKNWNRILDSYQYSMVTATQSRARAAAALRSKNFDRAWGRALVGSPSWSASTQQHLLELERSFLKEGSKLMEDIHKIQTQLTQDVIDTEMDKLGMYPNEMDPSSNTDNVTDQEKETTTNDRKQKKKEAVSREKLLMELQPLQKQLMQLELDFVKDIVATMGTQHASGVRAALLGDVAVRGSGGLLMQLKDRPLTTILGALESHETTLTTDTGETLPGSTETTVVEPTTTASNSDSNCKKPGNLFVARFSGDLRATQVTKLREEVTAIVRNAKAGQDQVLIVLESGGGTVTGYGLAAGQLQRLKDHGLYLTIAVEQVAASGGYMMCCVADRIVGSPFAVFGSIGVLTEIPNVSQRLKKEGVDYQTISAGKYKRTITPFKEVTEEDYDKTKEQLEGILDLFKGYVRDNRPQLASKMDDEIATGEVWFGTDAVKMGLCDEVMTADQVITDYVDAGCNVLELEYKPQREGRRQFAEIFAETDVDSNATEQSFMEYSLRWVARTVSNELIQNVAGGDIKRYLDGRSRASNYSEKFVLRSDAANQARV